MTGVADCAWIILIGIDKDEPNIAIDGKKWRNLRSSSGCQPPKQSLALGGIVLVKPIETDRVNPIGRGAKGAIPADRRCIIFIRGRTRVRKRRRRRVHRPINRIDAAQVMGYAPSNGVNIG